MDFYVGANDKRRTSSHEKKKAKGSSPESPVLAMKHPMCSRVMMESHKYVMPLTNRFGRETGIASKKSVVLRDEEEREWEVKVAKRNGAYYMSRGWLYFQRANQVQVGDTCVFTFITPPSPPPPPSEEEAHCLNLILDVQVVRKAKRKRGRPRGSTKLKSKVKAGQ